MKRGLLKLSSLGIVIISMLGLSACSSQQTGNQSTQSTSGNTHTVASPAENQLANLKYHSGKSAIVNVNRDKATIKPKWANDHVHYSKLDARLRTSYPNTAWIDKRNLAHDNLRTQQTFKPTGYHQKKIGGTFVVNRGHEIAYSLSKGIDQKGQYNPKRESGDQNNPKNLFTQSAFSNQELQGIYEGKVRQALRSGEKVVYQVQPIFKGSNEMANGVHMQAISTNHKLDYNVYIFNVQPGIKFNYKNGRSKVDNKMKVPTPANAPHYNDNNQNSNSKYSNRNYNKYNRANRYNYKNRYYRYNGYRKRRFMRRVGHRLGQHIRNHYRYKYGLGYGRHYYYHSRRYIRHRF